MKLSQLPKNIRKFCKGCGVSIQGGIHHTLCNKCWEKVHGVKDYKDIFKSGHSRKYIIRILNDLSKENNRLKKENENKTKHLIQLQEAIKKRNDKNG